MLDIRRKNLDRDAEIGRLFVRDDSLLADKIARLHIYYGLLMPNMTPRERNYLDAALVEIRFVTGSAKRLGQATNVDLENQFVMTDTLEIGKDLLAAGTFTATDFCTEKYKEAAFRKRRSSWTSSGC